MENRLEIIVAREGMEPMVLPFEQLHDIKDSITSIMLLWNTSSFYVDRLSKTFIVNGGRKLRMENLGECSILYRKRSAVTVSVNGGEQGRKVSWIIGLQDDHDKIVALKVDERGSTWEWIDHL